MNDNLYKQLMTLALRYKNIPKSKSKHFTFILKGNKVLSIGCNNSFKTHTKGRLCGYRFNSIHSELAAILKYKGDRRDLRSCVMVNLRINSLNQIKNAKPCMHCSKWLAKAGFKRIYYSTEQGSFVQMQYGRSYMDDYQVYRIFG